MNVEYLGDLDDSTQTIDSFAFDSFEKGILIVARHHLDALRCPESQAWHLAYSIAAERWGDRIGFPAAHLLARFLKHVSLCRDGVLGHIDPFCEHSRDLIALDEVELLYVVHFMRRDNTSAARNAVEDLTRGRMDPDVIRSGLTFANRFPAGAEPQERQVLGAKLRVVS
ncbi:hypothetical protein SAMN05444358_10274 [Ruegeria halocynthiae]|uniref:Uncharacterized protein n=1 Tax=Ruegeria halocynthiae TaxID=985054 RepID=A0A1H2XWN5_9RHOB|nr:hypothetical protein [Ruegeria halocynthiae]SDW97028.1 hypothetical protein SAMN05444358_10274 [Ruegeria halocynthiae]